MMLKRLIVSKFCVFTRPMLSQHIIAFVTILAIMTGAVWTRRAPVTTLSTEITYQARPGGQVIERAVIERNRDDCTVEVAPDLYDSQGTQFKIKVNTVAISEKGEASVARPYAVPYGVAWGSASLVVTRTYYCWPLYSLWPMKKVHPPLRFEILPP